MQGLAGGNCIERECGPARQLRHRSRYPETTAKGELICKTVNTKLVETNYKIPRGARGQCSATSEEGHDTEADRRIKFDIDEFRITETMDWILREGTPNHNISLQ
jgi:hypothetical protein